MKISQVTFSFTSSADWAPANPSQVIRACARLRHFRVSGGAKNESILLDRKSRDSTSRESSLRPIAIFLNSVVRMSLIS